MKFKVGDKVKRTRESVQRHNMERGGIYEVVLLDPDNLAIGLKGLNSTWNEAYFDLISEEQPNKKPVAPRYIVVWTENGRDPEQVFATIDEANECIKKLLNSSIVNKESIRLGELKSWQKVNMTFNLTQEKI